MPYKANAPRRHKIPRARYRVSNWPEYDRALQQRGSLTVWVTPEALAAWHPPRTGRPGRSPQYAAIAIETGHLPALGLWSALAADRRAAALARHLARSEGVPNRAANNVLLVVTHRPKGRDQVALQAGYAYPRNSDGGNPVQVAVGGTNVGFFTAGSSAFARDNKAAVAALRNGREAVARGPLPNGGRGQASDTFSLAGFAAAHDAISRECPAPAAAPASAPPSRR